MNLGVCIKRNTIWNLKELNVESHGNIKLARLNDAYKIKSTQIATASADYHGASGIIAHEQNFSEAFFDLKTRIAGEMLQKYSNYGMKLAIVGSLIDIQVKL